MCNMGDNAGIVRKVAQYCWSNKFLDVFQKYFTDHAYVFEDAPATLAQGEHNLEYHDLFTKYLKVYEDTLEDYLGQLEIPLEEFHKEVAEIQEDSEDPYLKQFVKCLLASADYDSFYRVMAREGKNYKIKKMHEERMREERRSSKGLPDEEPLEAYSSLKAEAKVVDGDEDDGYKGGGGGDVKGGSSSKGTDSPRDYK